MAGKIKGLTVVIDGDVTGLSKALRNIKSQTTLMKSSLKDTTRLLEMDPSSVEAITKKQGLLTGALSNTKRQLEALQEAHEHYSNFAGPLTEKEKRDWNELQRELARVELLYEELKDEAVDFGLAADSSILSAKGTFESLGESLTEIGNKLMPVSAAASFLGYSAIDAASKFESSFAGVRKTVNATEVELDNLKEAAREMALTKPIDVNDINYAMELGGQLGIAAENLDEFASVIADLDVATNLDLEDASLKLAQFANIANLGEDNFDKLGSTIVDLGNNSATTESKIMNMAMRIVGSGTNIGLSAQNVLALATSLASVGIEAEMGGNAISTIMNRIDKDVALNTETLQVWADTAGMSASEFKAAWDNVDSDVVMGAMMAVVEGMATYRDDGGNLNTLLSEMNISYMRQIDTMQRLSRTGEVVNKMVSIANGAWQQNNALTIEANRRYETTESQIQLLKNTLNELAIVIGNEMLPMVKEVVGDASDLILGFSQMDDETKRTIINFGMLAAASAPVALALGGLSTGMAKTIGGLASLGTSIVKYTTGLEGATEAEKKASAAKERAALKTSMLTKATGLLYGATATLAIAGIAVLCQHIYNATKHQENMKKATDGLRTAVGGMYKSAVNGRKAVKELGEELGDLYSNTEYGSSVLREAAEQQANLADSIKESFMQAGDAVGILEGYYNVIDELYGKTDLTAKEQAELSNAIQIINEKCGTSFEVVQDEAGAFVAMGNGAKYAKEEILKLIDAQQLQIQLTAYQEAYEEAYAAQMTRSEEVAAAWASYQEAAQKYYDAVENPEKYAKGRNRKYIEEMLIGLESGMNVAYAMYEEQLSYLNEADATTNHLYEQMVLLRKATDDGAGSIAFAAASCLTLMATFNETGVSALDFVSKLEDAKVSSDSFAGLTEEQMMNLASAFDGTFASISSLLTEYEIGFDGTEAEVSDVVDVITGLLNGLDSDQFDSLNWGSEIIRNIAQGIANETDDLEEAALIAAETIRLYLGHSIPKKGPLHNGGKGEVGWGEEVVGNLIEGMTNMEYDLGIKSSSIASIVSSGINGYSYAEQLAGVGGSGHVPSFLAEGSSNQSTSFVTHNHYSVGNIDYTGDAQVERAVVNLFDALERRANT